MTTAEDWVAEERRKAFSPPVPEGGWLTVLCTRRNSGTDIIGAPCPQCGHTNMLHPGTANPSLEACALCTVLGYQSETSKDHQ